MFNSGGGKNIGNLNKLGKKEPFVEKMVKKHAEKEGNKKVKQYRKEASRLASMANKRIQRLEKAGLTDSPAYQKWIAEGSVRFGVRGKTHNQLQSEVARMKRFIDSNTSTIRGLNATLKEMAKNTGIKYKNLKELQSKSKKFFELSSKVEQYLRTVDDMASAIGYQKIWTAINQYVKDANINLSDSEFDVDRAITQVTKAIKEFEVKRNISDNKNIVSGWYTLPKD